MEPWEIGLVSVIAPLALTQGARVLSARFRASQATRATDAEVGARFRDQLMARIDQLDKAVAECESDRDELRALLGIANARITVLEDRVRAGTSGQVKQDYLDEAAGL